MIDWKHSLGKDIISNSSWTSQVLVWKNYGWRHVRLRRSSIRNLRPYGKKWNLKTQAHNNDVALWMIRNASQLLRLPSLCSSVVLLLLLFFYNWVVTDHNNITSQCFKAEEELNGSELHASNSYFQNLSSFWTCHHATELPWKLMITSNVNLTFFLRTHMVKLMKHSRFLPMLLTFLVMQ